MRSKERRAGRRSLAIPLFAGVAGVAVAMGCAALLLRGLVTTLTVVGALVAGVILLRAATRLVHAPLLYGGTFLLILWLLTPSERIIFASDRDTPGRLQLYAFTVGDSAERLTATPGQDDAPAVSPDGRLIAFTRLLDGRERIYIGGRNGELATPAPGSGGNDRHPAWSPDGRWLAFASDRNGDWDIYVMSTDGSRLRNISRHPARDEWPTWSPDGRHLAFESDRSGMPNIWIVANDGTDVRALSNDSAVRRQPTWSPGGQQLAFVAGEAAERLCVTDLTGGVWWCLAGPGSYAAPAWSPSGQNLAYATRGFAGWELFIIPASGGEPRNVSRHPGLNMTPAWASNGPVPMVSRWWVRLMR